MLACLAATLAVAGPAAATEGYFQTGYGTVQKGQAGAGVAHPEDATSLAVNPAGLVDVGNQINTAFTLFSPRRQVEVTGGGFVATGTTTSRNDWFALPNVAYSRQIDGQSAWGVALYGNGGMNTTWPAVANGGGSGLFLGGRAGVDLQQLLVTVGYARRLSSDLSIGIAPVFAVQKFRAEGLGAFAGYSATGNLTSGRDDYAYGGGFRGGLQWTLRPGLRFGLSGQTPIWSTRFEKYDGLFADRGSFDIPGSVAAGIAFDVTPSVTLLADYHHIFYSAVPAVGNSSLAFLAGTPFGASGGSGFGWRDVDVVALGVSWRATTDLTLRAGYSHNTDPISSRDVLLNILAPAVVTDHLSTGLSWRLTGNSGFDLALGWVPRHHVVGVSPAAFGGQRIDLSMEQYEASAGYSYRF
ncbi:hydrocarbon degradation protein [Siculibacillus lacustris]|uniref:Hydrocarbon degradation protein n=2 Tax=Siculibacillus lacustris TaxID=1549641 RepID=A0A4Q9VJN1_9HYPH|nr:hydrocarbon degradation protein [Siculibacillus lacustris]